MNAYPAGKTRNSALYWRLQTPVLQMKSNFLLGRYFNVFFVTGYIRDLNKISANVLSLLYQIRYNPTAKVGRLIRRNTIIHSYHTFFCLILKSQLTSHCTFASLPPLLRGESEV